MAKEDAKEGAQSLVKDHMPDLAEAVERMFGGLWKAARRLTLADPTALFARWRDMVGLTMGYRIEFRRTTAVVDNAHIAKYLVNARHYAERALTTGRNGADFARIVDVASGLEIASIHVAAMLWDDA